MSNKKTIAELAREAWVPYGTMYDRLVPTRKHGRVATSREWFKLIVSLYDVHYPYNIDLTNVLKFIEDEKPDEVIFGWDAIDMEWVSKYYGRDLETWMYKTHDEIMWFIDNVLIPIKEKSPKTKIVFLDGNHEDRVWPHLAVKKEREQIIGHWHLMRDYVDVFVRYNDYYKVWHLYYIHGTYHNDWHAKKHALSYQKNIRYGHLHTLQEHALSTPVDDRVYTAKCVPCMCDLNPEYMRNSPSAWINWFNVAYVLDNDNFNDYNVVITDGKFIAPNWKLYE